MQCRMDEKLKEEAKEPDEGKRQIVDKSSDACDIQRLPLMRELSAKLTEGEKRSRPLPYILDIQHFQTLSPSHGLRRASPLPEGALRSRQTVLTC